MFARLTCTVLIIMGLTLGLSACTRIDLAYRNLDRLVPWSLNDYLDMNREQKRWLDARLDEQLAWHCQTQLPGYLDWLDRIRTMVADDAVTDAGLQQRTEEARAAIARVTASITPSAQALLEGLSDEQVQAMAEAFAKDIAERRKEYVDTPLPQQIAERAERMEKRLGPWFGGLNAAQRERIGTWSRALGDQNAQWIDNRSRWQQQLLVALKQRDTPAFAPQLASLLQDKTQLWTPAYRQAFSRTERETRGLLVDLVAASSATQRATLQTRLAKVRADFAKLKCLQG